MAADEPGGIDFAAAGLLDGLEDEQREERLALLEQLSGEGVPLSELRRATAIGTVMFLPADRVIGRRQRCPPSEVAELTGVDDRVPGRRPARDGAADPRGG